MGVTLGELVSLEYSNTGFFDEIDLLLPIPIHKVKKLKRGYNQSECIANGISNITNIPIDTSSIVKSVNTKSQTRRNRFERYKNVTDTFLLKNEHHLIDKHVLLIDDVLTTGATVEACGNLLRNIKGIRLSLLTIAYTN